MEVAARGMRGWCSCRDSHRTRQAPVDDGLENERLGPANLYWATGAEQAADEIFLIVAGFFAGVALQLDREAAAIMPEQIVANARLDAAADTLLRLDQTNRTTMPTNTSIETVGVVDRSPLHIRQQDLVQHLGAFDLEIVLRQFGYSEIEGPAHDVGRSTGVGRIPPGSLGAIGASLRAHFASEFQLSFQPGLVANVPALVP